MKKEKELILVYNAGSSSLKFSLYNLQEECLLKARIEKLGTKESFLHAEHLDEMQEFSVDAHNLRTAVQLSIIYLREKSFIKEIKEIKAIGHRVVHGGRKYQEPTIITRAVEKQIEKLFELAPLHNPANLKVIKEAKKYFKKAKQIAVFDTAYHSTLKEEEFLYGLPYSIYKKYGIRKYGFHGINHEYSCLEATKLIKKQFGKNAKKIITIHLGNGSSITANKNCKSIDTSMGFSPMDGLIMGTRSGQLDPEIIFYLGKKLGYKELEKMLNKESGLKGLTGYSDMREVWSGYQNGDEKCVRAMNLLATEIKEYVGRYSAILGGVDAIVFTGGMGQYAYYLRELSLKGLDYFGIKLDKKKNDENKQIFSKKDSKTKLLVIPANEELMIMRKVKELM